MEETRVIKPQIDPDYQNKFGQFANLILALVCSYEMQTELSSLDQSVSRSLHLYPKWNLQKTPFKGYHAIFHIF